MGSGTPPLAPRNPPLLFLTVILSQQECNGLSIPEILDHLQSEMKTYFNPTNDAVLSSLFNLLPELVAVGDRNPDIEAALEFYENDLPSPHVVDVELLRWKRKWCSTEDADLPTSAVQTLAACDREFFPNIHTLIRILCTLPITSAECERSFSTLRRLKTYLRSTMSSERESGLALMNINYHRDINIEEVINTFAQRQPRRLLFAYRKGQSLVRT